MSNLKNVQEGADFHRDKRQRLLENTQVITLTLLICGGLIDVPLVEELRTLLSSQKTLGQFEEKSPSDDRKFDALLSEISPVVQSLEKVWSKIRELKQLAS